MLFRINAPWAPSDKTRIVGSGKKIDETIVKQSKTIYDKALSYIITINDLPDVTLAKILEDWSYSRTV